MLSLKKVFLYPTMKCNLNCKMCYSKSSIHSQYSELSIEQYKLLIEKLYGSGVRSFDISGGEPFLSPNLYDLVCYIKSLKNTQIFLVSNGTLIESKYEEYIKIIKNVDRIQISLDSFDPNHHNDIRQSVNAYQRTIISIDKLTKDFSGIVGLNTVIMNSNQDQVIPILNFALDRNIQNVSFLRYIDVVENNNLMLNLENNEYSSFVHSISKWSNTLEGNLKKLNVEVVLPGYMYKVLGCRVNNINNISVKYIYDPIRGCHAFENNIIITHGGNVTGCTAFVKYNEMYCGNILYDNPNLLEHRYLEFSSLLKRREAYLRQIEPCRSCEYFSVCRGGCPASAYKMHHSIMYSDPTCVKNLSKSDERTKSL